MGVTGEEGLVEGLELGGEVTPMMAFGCAAESRA